MMLIPDLRLHLYPLSGKTLKFSEFTNHLDDIMIKMDDGRYVMPDGLDSAHIIDIMITLGWITKIGARYYVEI